ncbi:MAG: phosphoribosyl-ATP pyrophosphatase, partial [Desulfuromonadaceae bacterium]|nr:phosphoribosyl-ATP pyrophosphatase [Desulfuromonadaceae bacterium]
GIKSEIVYESADLIFHLLVLLGHQDIEPEAVYDELRRRFGISGIDEKAARKEIK